MNTTPPPSQEVWRRTPAEAQGYIRALEARVAALEATIQRRMERLRQDSQHSSRSPSSDPLQATKPRSPHAPSGRKPGGQPGHEGQTRALVPVEDVDGVIPVKPAQCSRCQHRLICLACGEATRVALPQGVPTGEFGPRVQATVALCTGAYHLSKRTTQNVVVALVYWLLMNR